MANRYYIITGPSQANRLISVRNRLANIPGLRSRSGDIIHWITSPDGSRACVQANVTDEEHAWLLGNAWVQYIGDAIDNRPTQGVADYFNANRAIWPVD